MKRELSRRDFLKIAATVTAVTVPTVSGYGLLRAAEGDLPPSLNPYVQEEVLARENQAAPILILTNESTDNPFGFYLGEILRAEGLNCFQMVDISKVNTDLLQKYDIVILAEGRLSNSQVELLEGYVYNGGQLIAMRPGTELETLLGVERTSGNISEGYLQTESEHPVADGIASDSLQFHGEGDLYRLVGADTVAWLDQGREVGQQYPAVTLHTFGKGQAAMWAYDLAKSVAYTRQGNPKWSNQERDGLNGIRTVDMFSGWIDLDRIHIPQADEQQRLLVNLLVGLSHDKRPLPRVWYFPGEAKGMLVATGDSHMNPFPIIEQVLHIVEKYNGHITVYYSPLLSNDFRRAVRVVGFWATDKVPYLQSYLREKFTSPTPLMVSNWRARGHEFALHPWVEAGLDEGWRSYWQEFTGKGYGPVPPTVRTHRILWSGWVESARIQRSYNIGMNMDYYHVGPSLQTEDSKWVYGHLTGSGLPMKFVDEHGQILDIFQQLTQLADEHLIPMDVSGWGGWPNLSPYEAVEVSKLLLDRSMENGGYAAIGGQFHFDPFQVGGEPAGKAAIFLEGSLKYANKLGIPIWSAQEWLDFTKSRHDSEMRYVRWNHEENLTSFSLQSRANINQPFNIMIPESHADKGLVAVEVDGSIVKHSRRIVGGIKYASLTINVGNHDLVAYYN